MWTITLRCWIAHLVGLLLCVLALQIRRNDGNFTEADNDAARSILNAHRRWSRSMRAFSSKLVTTSSPSSDVLPPSEPPSSNEQGTNRPIFGEPPYPVGSPVKSLPEAPAPVLIAPNSAPQPAIASNPPTSAGARTGLKTNSSITPISSLPLPALPSSSSQLPSAPPMQPLSHASAPSPIHRSPHVAQPSLPAIRAPSEPPSPTPLLHIPPGRVAPSTASTMPPPNGNTTSVHSPLTSPSSGCCAPNMVPKPGLPSDSCICVYPIRLELLVEDVSTDSENWSSEFQQELASQLGLKVIQIEITSFELNGPNLSLVIEIGPLTGSSFSLQQAETIKNELDQFKVHFNSSLFGNYTLLRFRYFEAPSPPPVQTPAPEVYPVPPSQKRPKDALIDRNKGHPLSLPFIIGITAGAVIVVVVILIILWRYLIPCRAGKQTYKCSVKGTSTRATSSPIDAASHETRSIPRSATTRSFTFEELKHATNNFEPASVLGEGGFGRVYKGVLKDGTAVAIKRLTGGGHQGDREFLVEVEMLSRLHHRNLVKLIGYYTSGDSLQHLLCYELIPNGSLESWLHGHLGANLPLDWDTRMKIALDAARGLAYLHEDSQPCVIHRDFKASNILIENDFHAKVADFGLAKQAPEGQINYVSTRVMGTFGYVAPEYAMTGHLLVKSDVYSYGVVLLELLSGRKPVDMSQPSGQENLVTWARPLLRDIERLEDLPDPRLFGKYPRDDFAQVAAIAAACVSPEASQRPTMGEVVQSLKMVQRSSEYPTSGERNTSADTTMFTSVSTRSITRGVQNARPTSTTFESDGSSSVFSSGPFSGLSGLESDVLSRTVLFSEDLHEGR